jgi:hypothetical protein
VFGEELNMKAILNTLLALALLLIPFARAEGADPPRSANLSHALSVGDRFQLNGMSQNTKHRHVTITGDNPPDLNLTTTVTYSYDVEVLAVSAGRSTKQRCRITQLAVDSGAESRSLIDGTPTVLVSVDEQNYTKIDVEQGTVSQQALGGLYHVIHLETRRVAPEMLMASDSQHSIGDEWSIPAEILVSYLSERELDVEPESAKGTAQFVGTKNVEGRPCDEFVARLSSEKLRISGVLPDEMQMTSASVEVSVRIYAPHGKTSPILRESTEMTVLYSGRGSQGGIALKADHKAQVSDSWTRTPLEK